MILVVDCFKLVKGKGKSIGIYNLAKSILQHMTENAAAGPGDRLIVLGNKYNRADMEQPGTEFIEMKGDPLNKLYDVWWELFAVAGVCRKLHADRIFFPRGYRPLVNRIPDTIIVHDLIPFYYNENYPGYLDRIENAYIMTRLKASILHADSVVTISKYSCDDIMRRFPAMKKREDRIHVIYNGVNTVTSDTAYGSADRTGYIAAVTSMMPHKNAAGILRAYEYYYRHTDSPLELRVIGIESTEQVCAVYDSEAAGHVRCYRYIDDYARLCRVIGGAEVFLFLSYIEGFGFPPIEAMQLGVPVVCSDRTSLPEVVGDAGILVSPDDPKQVSEAVNKVTGDRKLRDRLIAAGYENIKRFGWDSRLAEYSRVLWTDGSRGQDR
jgi:glycosyltransferase involved in cell wall biosynthesis